MDFTNTLPQVSSTQILRETAINALLADASGALMFGRDPDTSTALTWGYLGGRLGGTLKAGGTVTATDASTNYVVADKSTLAVSIATAITNWNNTTTYGRMYLLTASGGAVTNYEDHRNGTNGILTSATGSGGGSSGITINAQTGTTYTVLVGDLGKLVTHSNASAIAVTLPQATGSFTTPFYYYTKNLGVGAVTITPTTSTINGLSTLVLNTGQSVAIVSDGTNYQTALQPPGIAVNAQTGTTYTYLNGDRGKLVTHTNGSAIAGTLPQATGAFGVNWFVYVQNRGAGTLTVTPTTSTIDGAATLALTTGQGTIIFSDGTNYFTMRGGAGIPASPMIVLSPAYAATVTVDLTSYTAYPIVVVDVGTLTGNVTFNITNGVNGQIIRVRLTQDGTGSRIFTAGAALRFSTDVPSPTLSTAINTLDRLAFEWHGGASKADLVSVIKGY